MRILLFLILLIYNFGVNAQNEFYINGALVTLESNALVHVQGDVHLDNEGVSQGQLNNDGLLELRGNFIIENSNVEQTGVNGSSIGIVRLKNYGYSLETAHQNSSQRIHCNGADATGSRAFYSLEIENNNQSNAGTLDNYVDIQGGDIEVKNELKFNNDSRIITDDAGYTSDDGSTYDHEVYVSNDDVNAIVGASTTSGDVTRYVEGKLAREVSGSQTYYFPVGIEPGGIGADGMEAFQLETTVAAQQKMSSYLNLATMNLVSNNVFCDIGEDPGAGSQAFSGCVGGPDGIFDYIFLNEEQSHEWIVTNGGTDYDYNIEVFPGTGLSATANHATGSCGPNNYAIKFLARDGLITGGNVAIAPGPNPYQTLTGVQTCPPASLAAGNRLENQTSFSTFRIHGATDNSTLLPVEVVSFEAYPVNNEFIQVAWVTGSEINNSHFEIERSIDAIVWEYIDEVGGNGTTTNTHYYTFNDVNVQAGITYYYRLKQVDLDGAHEYIGPDDARLSNDALSFTVSEFIPNPTMNTSSVYVTTPINKELFYLFYNDIGQIIEQGKIDFSAGSIDQPILLSRLDELAAATYFITITDGEQIYSRTLIKQ